MKNNFHKLNYNTMKTVKKVTAKTVNPMDKLLKELADAQGISVDMLQKSLNTAVKIEKRTARNTNIKATMKNSVSFHKSEKPAHAGQPYFGLTFIKATDPDNIYEPVYKHESFFFGLLQNIKEVEKILKAHFKNHKLTTQTTLFNS